MPQNTFDDKSTLIEAVARCRQTKNISRANIDPIQRCHMASLNHNDLKPQGFTNKTIQKIIIGKTTYRPMVHTAYVIIASYHYNDVIMTTMASQKSPALRLLTQSFIQAQIKENIKAVRHWPLCGEFTGTGEFPAQRASYAENVSIWWRHHVRRRNLTACAMVKV